MSSCTFTSNRGAYGVIDIFIQSSVIISASNFNNNSASHDGGVIFSILSHTKTVNCTYDSNNALHKGGVLLSLESSLDIINCAFKNNRANYGGVMATAAPSDTSGYNLHILYRTSRNSSFNITNTSFTNNSAEIGGVIYDHYTESSVYITNCTITSNRGATGVIHIIQSSLIILDSNFNNNSASHYGGVISSILSHTKMVNCIYDSNNALHSGGILISFESSFDIINCAIKNNRANCGGVIATAAPSDTSGYTTIQNRTSGNSSFNITNTSFTNNSAEIGGVIFDYNTELSVLITNCTIDSNRALIFGGVIATVKSSFHIINSSINNNSAYFQGGAFATFNWEISSEGDIIIHNQGTNYSQLYIINSNFSHNYAGQGGVIYAESFSLSSFDSTFLYNIGELGGVILAINSSLNITGSRFECNNAYLSFGEKNNATYYDHASGEHGGIGGVIVFTSLNSSANITTSTFINNSAVLSGVIGIVHASLFNIINCIFTDNSAAEDGHGAVSKIANGDIINIINCTFRNNIDEYSLETVTSLASSIYIINSIFEYNTGSLFAMSSNITFQGYVKFENNRGFSHNSIRGILVSGV